MKDENAQLDKEQFVKLVEFLREETGEVNMPITRQTLIEDDLGVTGDEAAELISNFSKRYGVNIQDFIFEHYFYDEPGIFDFPNRTVKPFSVGGLEKAIITGRLDEEIIDNSYGLYT